MARWTWGAALLVSAVWACGDDGGASGSGGSGAGGGVTTSSGQGAGSSTSGTGGAGGATDPELIDIAALSYQGAFRVPATEVAGSSFNFSQGPIAVHPTRGSVFLVGHVYEQAIAELDLPTLSPSTSLGDLPMATFRQTFAQVIPRAPTGNPQAIDTIVGLAIVQGQLVIQAIEYYDAPADNTHTTLVLRDPSALATSAVAGFASLDARAHAAGWLAPIPAAWQSALGGEWLLGASSGMPIISRLSVGPSAFAVDPAALVADPLGPTIPTQTLLDYDLERPLAADLDNASGDNDLWTHLSRATFGFIPPGSRSYLVLGQSGGHGPLGVCYKCVPTGETEECGGFCAAEGGDHGLHYWVYDVADLAAVRAGSIAAHELRPYAQGPFSLPFGATEIGGGSYDASTGLLYLTLPGADDQQGEYANPPVVAAFQVVAP